MGCSFWAIVLDILHKLCDVQLPRRTNNDAPITRLPNEILAEIFHQGHISSEGGIPFRFPTHNTVPFRSSICLVTRHWREVAVNTSSLWTRLVVKPIHSPKFIGMYLHRSKDRPLVIHFSYWGDISFSNLPSILPLLTLSAYRWHELIIRYSGNFYSDEDDMSVILQSLHDLEAPILNIIDVEAPPESRQDVVKHIFMRGAPRLSRVHLRAITLRGCRPPMDNATTFHMRGVWGQFFHGSDIYEMLEALPSVTNLVLENVLANFDSGDPKRKFAMFSLRRLMIYAGRADRNDGMEATFLRHVLAETISAPNLETLVIAWGSYEAISNAVAALAAPPLKFPTLTSLELWNSFSDGITRDFLQSLHNLEELALIQCGHNTLQLLLDEGDSPILLPHLHTLTLGTNAPLYVQHQADIESMGLLCELVADRARLGIPIGRVRLYSRLYSADPRRIEWLQARARVEDIGSARLEWCQ